MSMKKSKTSSKFALSYERGMLRSVFRSIFWAVIADKKKRGGFTFRSLAKAVGADRGKVSHWFNGDPNWTINTIAALANGLGLDLHITATERATGCVFTAAGIQDSAVQKPKPMPVQGITETTRSIPVRYIRGPSSQPPMTSTSASP
jgi:transcriptional regulator with XRE-family HTH domain